jgi:uncharacterized protein
MDSNCLARDYVTRVLEDPAAIDAADWNRLLETHPSGLAPFMRHEYLAALHASGSAVPGTGWTPRWVTLWYGDELAAAAPLTLKAHSYGEYVFDWAWAEAYERHGLAYYPKGLIAVPFTPVPGPRLLARDGPAREALVQALVDLARQWGLSSLHLLFAPPEDIAACEAAGWMPRQTVQFHWTQAGYRDFDAFLATLSQDKRKKIRQERRKVAEAGVSFEARRGRKILEEDWAFFYRCYERTYLEHGNAPYLSRDFFARLQASQPGRWLMFLAKRQDGRPIASSLIGLSYDSEQPELLPAPAVVHRPRGRALRGGRPGGAQDGACPDASGHHECPLAGPPRLRRRGGALPRAGRGTGGTLPGPPGKPKPLQGQRLSGTLRRGWRTGRRAAAPVRVRPAVPCRRPPCRQGFPCGRLPGCPSPAP